MSEGRYGDVHPLLTTRHVYDCDRCGQTFGDFTEARRHVEDRCPSIADPHEVTVAELPGTARSLVLTPHSDRAHLYANCGEVRGTDRIVAPVNELADACARVVDRRVTPEGLKWCRTCLDRYVEEDT